MTDHVLVERAGGVLTLTMARPEKKNALTSAMYQAMAEAIAGAGMDRDIGAILILGQPGFFSAGNDLNDFARFAASGNLGAEVLAFLRALVACERPLVAAVDGVAVGVGTTLLMHCDYVLVSDRASLSTPFVNLGLVPEAASSLIAPRLMGQARAFELLVMGRPFGPEQAVASGLANAIVPAAGLADAAMAVAREIAAKPREAVLASRRLMRGDADALLERVDIEARLFAERLKSAEAQARFKAFLAKSPPATKTG
jgi:enoyl-CoA hydratase/carnithine racemase